MPFVFTVTKIWLTAYVIAHGNMCVTARMNSPVPFILLKKPWRESFAGRVMNKKRRILFLCVISHARELERWNLMQPARGPGVNFKELENATLMDCSELLIITNLPPFFKQKLAGRLPWRFFEKSTVEKFFKKYESAAARGNCRR